MQVVGNRQHSCRVVKFPHKIRSTEKVEQLSIKHELVSFLNDVFGPAKKFKPIDGEKSFKTVPPEHDTVALQMLRVAVLQLIGVGKEQIALQALRQLHASLQIVDIPQGV